MIRRPPGDLRSDPQAPARAGGRRHGSPHRGCATASRAPGEPRWAGNRANGRRLAMNRRWGRGLLAALLVVAVTPPAGAQAPIKIGEINTYSGIAAPFTGPY